MPKLEYLHKHNPEIAIKSGMASTIPVEDKRRETSKYIGSKAVQEED
jgi:hypothetical protein